MQAFVNYAGLILGVLSIVATIFFAVRYAERKDPTALVLSDRKILLSADAPSTLEVRYKDRQIPRLTSTYVWFWNAGRRPIKREDIAAKTPVRVDLSSADDTTEILEVAVRRVTRASIEFSASRVSATTVELTFEFLDQRDGALVEIQHTGKPSVTVVVSGVMLGAPNGIRRVRDAQAFSPLLPPFGVSRSVVTKLRTGSRLLAMTMLAMLWVFSWLLWTTRHDITTNRDLLNRALSVRLSGAQLAAAIQAIDETGKMRSANMVLPYILAVPLVLMTGVLLFEILRPRPSLPAALSLTADGGSTTEAAPAG